MKPFWPGSNSPDPESKQVFLRYDAPPLNESILRFRRRVTQRTTMLTRAGLLIGLEFVHSLLDLRPEIGTMEARLVHLLPTTLTIPPQPVHAPLGPMHLNHNADRIGEPDGVMRRVRGQEEHVALVDVDVAEGAVGVDDLEEHAALVLVEPFRGLVDVVVCAGVGTADDHDGEAVGVVDAVVVYGGLEHVGVFFDPGEGLFMGVGGGIGQKVPLRDVERICKERSWSCM